MNGVFPLKDVLSNEDEYWKHFRREAAKEILVAIVQNDCTYWDESAIEDQADHAIRYADALIKRLKK